MRPPTPSARRPRRALTAAVLLALAAPVAAGTGAACGPAGDDPACRHPAGASPDRPWLTPVEGPDRPWLSPAQRDRTGPGSPARLADAVAPATTPALQGEVPLLRRPAAIGSGEDDPDPGVQDWGAQGWPLCITRPHRRAEFDHPDPALADGTVKLSADRSWIRRRRIYELVGDARLERQGQIVEAQRMVYDQGTGELFLDEGAHLYEPELEVHGERAYLRLDQDSGDLKDIDYVLYGRHAQGEARMAYQLDALHRRLEQASYTTCDPSDPDWLLTGREIDFDHAEGVGRAYGVLLKAGPVPVAYTPYLKFPIDDRRQSGFLAPSIGSSGETGAQLALPYYWNIAPNQDATLTPRLLAKRGVQGQAEYRYLWPHQQGEIYGEYLPGDELYGADRSLIDWRHEGRLSEHLDTRVRYREVSDRQYFEDLGGSLTASSRTHLERHGDLDYRYGDWSGRLRLQDFQTLDPTVSPINRPYKRLPQLTLRGRPLLPWGTAAAPLRLDVDAELVHFTHDDKVQGSRLDLKPELRLPWRRPAYFVEPSLALRHTAYRLTDATGGRPDSPGRTLPIASLDSGLFFERNLEWNGRPMLQTLEPRAYYLYVPYRDQTELPVFDTGRFDFNLTQLFADNRFTGADRQGDANQLTLAVSSRLIDPSNGDERASLTLGEILYFRDRRVTLPRQPVEGRSTSNLVGQLDLRLREAWRLGLGGQYDPNESKTQRVSTRIQYQSDDRHLVNLAYRLRAGELEQVDASALWNFTPRWHGIFRSLYSLDEHRLLDGMIGAEYESCCWLVRLVARSYVNDSSGMANTGFLFQIELKGLTSFGDPIQTLLRDTILGYPTS